jgi:hypothetical protein
MDDKDRNKARAEVAGAMLFDGHPERAKEMADGIEDWRRGAIYADMVVYQVLHGLSRFDNEALLDAASRVADENIEWRMVRVHEHIAMAKAVQGKTEEVEAIRTRFEIDNAVRGKLGAYLALAKARTGMEKEALTELERLGGETLFDINIWNVQGLLLLAREGGGPEESRLNALEAAWAAADKVPGFKKHQIKMQVIEAWGAAGKTEQTMAAMEDVDSAVVGLGHPAHIKAPLMAEVAISWAKQGDAERVRVLEPLILSLIDSDDMQNIERPAALALIAEANGLAGNRDRALELYKMALERSLELVNPRPRALAAVSVCLSLQRSGLGTAELEESLKRLHATMEPYAE